MSTAANPFNFRTDRVTFVIAGAAVALLRYKRGVLPVQLISTLVGWTAQAIVSA